MKTKRGNKRSNKVKYGDVDAGLANVRPDEIKVRITTFLDLDVLETLKAQAKEIGMGYQTYLNTFLRETVLNEPGVITRLKRIEKAILG
ncbi:MAG: BrnA antitoxin family protein, partial [Bdellovibrionales bacterium]